MLQILIDWSAFVRVALERQYSKTVPYTPRSQSPVIELGFQCMKALAKAKGRWHLQPTEFILCLDPVDSSGVFRNKIIDDYYDKYLWVATNGNKDAGYLVTFDGKFFHVKFDTYKGELVHKTVTKKGSKEFMADGFKYVALSSLPSNIQEFIDTTVKPNYKAGRVWPYEHMTKEFYNQLRNLLAYRIAPMYGMKVWEDPNLEADDLIFRAATADTFDKVVVTTDGDLEQLMLYNPMVQILNPQTRKYVEKNTAQLKYGLMEKILRGDKSDNIMGTATKKGSPTTPKGAEKIIQHAIDTKTTLQQSEELHDFTLDKNYKLISLAHAPLPVTKPFTPEWIPGVTFESYETSREECSKWISVEKMVQSKTKESYPVETLGDYVLPEDNQPKQLPTHKAN